MSSLIERRASALGALFEPTQPVFDLATADLQVFRTLTLDAPAVAEAFEAIRRRIPFLRRAEVGADRHFYRLPGQNRSFCYALGQGESSIEGAAVVFKGSEPLLEDYPTLVDWMLQAPLRRSTRVMADHFPLSEGKIPGALSMKEAIREAAIALDIQHKYLLHYGELARIPTPLLVHSLSEDRRATCAAVLSRKLSQAAFERIEPMLRDGLGIYIYYYPCIPLRANFLSEQPLPRLQQFIERTLDAERVASGWVRLLIRLLYLGYLPYSVRSEGLGACMDFGNATLDGGFCDPDSVIALDASMDDEFVRESVIQGLLILQSTIQRLLDLSNPPSLYPSIEDFVCRQYICHLVSEAVESEGRAGLRLDDRVSKLLSPQTVSDIRICTRRRNRIRSYSAFAKRK